MTPDLTHRYTAPAVIAVVAQAERIPVDWLDNDSRAVLADCCDRAQALHDTHETVASVATALALAISEDQPVADLLAVARDAVAARALADALPPEFVPDLDDVSAERIAKRIRARRATLSVADLPLSAAARDVHAWRISGKSGEAAPGVTTAERDLDRRRLRIASELAAHYEEWDALGRTPRTNLDALERLVSLMESQTYLIDEMRRYAADVATADATRRELGLTWQPDEPPAFTTA